MKIVKRQFHTISKVPRALAVPTHSWTRPSPEVCKTVARTVVLFMDPYSTTVPFKTQIHMNRSNRTLRLRSTGEHLLCRGWVSRSLSTINSWHPHAHLRMPGLMASHGQHDILSFSVLEVSCKETSSRKVSSAHPPTLEGGRRGEDATHVASGCASALERMYAQV